MGYATTDELGASENPIYLGKTFSLQIIMVSIFKITLEITLQMSISHRENLETSRVS
jgi:hypothetical protein